MFQFERVMAQILMVSAIAFSIHLWFKKRQR